jgi:hypothetical protein
VGREGLLLVGVTVVNPPDQIVLPPGVLEPGWRGEDGSPLGARVGSAPGLEDASVFLPTGSTVWLEFRLPLPGRALGAVAWKLGISYRTLPKELNPGTDDEGDSVTVDEPAYAEVEAAFRRWAADEWDEGPAGGTAALRPEDGRFRASLCNVGEWALNLTGAFLFVVGERRR